MQQIDFGAFRTPGTYRLKVDGRTSHAFTIAADVYRPLSRASLNFFYQQRAGVAIDARFAGGTQWARAAGHVREVVTCFKGMDQAGTDWPGCPYTLDVTGGWYDAGDQGKYVVNGGIALWMLQNLYEVDAARPPSPMAAPHCPRRGTASTTCSTRRASRCASCWRCRCPTARPWPCRSGGRGAGRYG